MKMKKHAGAVIVIAMAVVMGLTGGTARAATSITVTNAGFENPALADGVWQDTVPGWSEGRYAVTNPTVWLVGTAGGDVGVYDVSTSEYTSGNPPEGENMGFTTSVTNYNTGMNQVLAGGAIAKLQANATYVLSAVVGNPYLYNGDVTADYRIELVAGGVVLASTNGPSPVDDTYWTTGTVTYVSGAAPAQLGQPLEIRLLAVDFTRGYEVDYDSVALTVTLAQPVAVPGGPYTVPYGGSLSLIGTNSLPSDGASITAYDWDLNNDSTFGDATGAVPAAISYATLTNTWGMIVGANSIGLRVIDSAPLTNIAATTVTLLPVSTNALLSNLVPTPAMTFTPTFASNIFSYTASVANAISNMTVTPTAAGAGATITVNGTNVVSGNPSGSIGLIVGSNLISTVVTAQDAVTSNAYTLTVTRAAAGGATNKLHIGASRSNGDNWNVAANWSPAGVPIGTDNVFIQPNSKFVTSEAPVPPRYTGNLSITNSATLQISYGGSTPYIALGTAGSTVITMWPSSTLFFRGAYTTNVPQVVLNGNITIVLGSSTSGNPNLFFRNGINGPYTITLGGKTGAAMNLNDVANSWTLLTASFLDPWTPNGQTINANFANSLGGDVTTERMPENSSTGCLLVIGAANAMVDSGTLTLNAQRMPKITMNANDTIAKLVLNGVEMPAGAYTAAGLGAGWMSGNGTLTVSGGTTPYYWDLNDTTAGAGGLSPDGTWDAASNYWNAVAAGTGSAAAWTAGQTAVFAAGTDARAPYTVTVSGTPDIGGLSFEEGTVTLSGGALRMTTNSPVYVAGWQTATVATPISNDATARNLSKGGPGTLVLAGTNTYTGVTGIGLGTLSVASLANAGSPSGIGAYPTAGRDGLLLGRGTFRYTGGTVSINRGFDLGDDGAIDVSGANTALTLGICRLDAPSTLTVKGGAGSSLNLASITNRYAATLNPMTIPLTVGWITGYYSFPCPSGPRTGTPGITLSGTASGNSVTGTINLTSGALTKNSIGTWTLFGGRAGTDTAGTTFTGGGTVILDYAPPRDVGKLPDAQALTLSGGTVTLNGGTHTEIVSATTLNTAGTFLTRTGGSTGKLRLNAITRTVGGTIDFADATIADTDRVNTSGILGGYATLGGTDWAVNSTGGGDGAITAYAAYTTPFPAAGPGLNTNNYFHNVAGQAQAAVAANSLKIANGQNSDTLTLNGNLTITSTAAATLGGVLYVGGFDNLYTIAGAGIIVPSGANQELIFNVNTGTLTISAFVAASGASSPVTKTGPGTLVLTAANSFTGNRYVNQGVLRLTNLTPWGNNNTTYVQNGAALEFGAAGTFVNPRPITLVGVGISTNGALRNLAGNTSSYGGAITIGLGGARINSDVGGALTLTAGIVTAALGQDVTIGGAGNVTAGTAAISGGGMLIKDGAGILTLTLAAGNTYTGGTILNGGTLRANNTSGSGAGTGDVTVNAGTLDGSGIISGNVAVNGGTLAGTLRVGGNVTVGAAGSLTPGSSVGTNTVGGNLDIAALADGGTGKLNFELAGTTDSDKIAVTNGALIIGSGKLGFGDFVFTDLVGFGAGTYKLITTTAGISGTLDPADLLGLFSVGPYSGTLQINGNDLELVVVAGDIVPPRIANLSPANNATNAAVAGNLVATFDENIVVLTNGVITITNLTDATGVDITLPDAQVSAAGTGLTINPTNDLDYGDTYAVLIDANSVEDTSGNKFAGITNVTGWRFTTDRPPALLSLSPTNNAVEVEPNTDLAATFDETIALVNGGVITITNLTDATVTSLVLPDAQVTAAGTVLTINPTNNLDWGDLYAVLIDANAVSDTNGNNFAGIAADTTWRFTTKLPDVTPPSLVSLSPTNGASDLWVGVNLAATFDENIVLVTNGVITITNLTDATATNIVLPDAQVSVSNAVVTIDLAANLEFGDTYAVLIESNTLGDAWGNVFAGITNDTTWQFTAGTPPAIVSLDPTNNAIDVEPGTNLVATFDKTVVLLTNGVITITNLTDGTATTITIPNAQVTTNGAVLTINPIVDLKLRKHYAVQISANAIKGLNQNIFGGIADDVTWNFTVRDPITTTITNTAGGNDSWNTAANWDRGVPVGEMNAVIKAGIGVSAENASTPNYGFPGGDLTISNSATLQIGWTVANPQNYNAFGYAGRTTIYMYNGAYVNIRVPGLTFDMPSVRLMGNASLCTGSSTGPNASPSFNYGINGPYTFTFYCRAGGSVTLSTSNNFAGLVTDGQYGTGGNINANAAGSLATNVTMNALSGVIVANLIINAANAMPDTGTLSLNGTSPTLLRMNASDTIARLFVNGVQQPYGTYGSNGNPSVTYPVSWLAGAGILTIPEPPSGYWDLNDTTAGAGGPTPAGTWDAANTNWNNVAAGTNPTAIWTPGQAAVFAAGTDATGTYAVTVDSTQDVGRDLKFEEGAVTLSGGELRLTADTSVNVATDLTATVATVITNDATAWRLSKTGPGTLVLSGANTYAGVTKVEGGTLSVASLANAGTGSPVGAYPTAGPTGLVFSAGTFRYTGGTVTINRGFTMQGACGLDVNGAGTTLTLGACDSAVNPSTLTVTGGAASSLAIGQLSCVEAAYVTLNPTAASMTVASVRGYTSYPLSSAVTLSGTTAGNLVTGGISVVNPPLSGYTMPISVTKSGSGSWGVAGTLSGSVSTVTVNGGTLTLSSGSSGYYGQLTVQNGTLSIPTINNVSANGPLGNNASAVILGGAGGQRGTLQYTGGTASSTKPFTLTAGGTGVFQVDSGAAVLTLGGAIGSSGALVKTGAGTLALSAANGYSGTTTVSNGTLLVNGSSLATNTVTVDSGCTLGGTGTIGGLTTVASGATLSPGAAGPGTLTFSRGLTLNSGGTIAMQLGTSSDLVRVTVGTITGPAAGTVAINVTASSGMANGTYTLIDWTGATPSSVDVSDFAVTLPPNWVARLYIVGSKLMLDVKAATSFIKFQ